MNSSGAPASSLTELWLLMPISARKQNDYDPQSGPYKVKVKTGAGWRQFKTCRLPISIGKDAHEGDKFSATLEWTRQRFEKIIFCVNDTLQRFNLMSFENLSEDEARAKAETLGSQWLERHRASIDSLAQANAVPAVRHEIWRWNHWLEQKQFPVNLALVNRLYQENAAFRQAVEADIDLFLSRRSVPNVELFRQCSRRYLLEESAAFAIMFSQEEAADIYPGKEIETTRIAREQSLAGAPAGLEKRYFTRIDFSRAADATPQPFIPNIAPANYNARREGR